MADEGELTQEDLENIREALGTMGLVFGDNDDDEESPTVESPTVEELAEFEPEGNDPEEFQWAKTGGVYAMVGATRPTLPAGYYSVVSTQNGIVFMPLKNRTDDILRFPHAEVDTVIAEMEIFWKREKMFKDFGLPFKRGILMYGPPGSGKTSALQLVARDVIQRGGVVLNWDSNVVAAYRQIRMVQPETPVVILMEDLDELLATRASSGLLNVLDGAEEMHKVVFVATTNYPEKLGPRIINRPSRFDKRIRVGHPDVIGRRMYLEHLVDGHDLDLDVERYVKDTHGMSIAHLKELFVATAIIGAPYDGALHALKAMHLERATSADDDKEFAVTTTGQYV